MAGVTVGYFFRKMEEEFTRYGEGLMLKMVKSFKGDGEESSGRSHSRRRFEVDDDPLGEGNGHDFDDDSM